MEVCRLCLDLQSNNTYSPLEGTYKDMVQVVAPELNIEISNAPIVCNECSSNLDELFIFKTKCFENEQKIRPKCENTKNKLRLKEVLDGTTNVDGTPLKIEKAKERICRTCMGHIECESFTILKPSEPDAYLDSMLTMCLPEVDLELTKDPVICETCMDNLQKLHHFKSTCLDIEDKLANYCETHGTNSSDQINLHSVLEYDVSNTDSGFVNVKSEVFDEESVDTSMKSENDSEMTGDTELKQEEVDIKSEAGTSSASDKKMNENKMADPQIEQPRVYDIKKMAPGYRGKPENFDPSKMGKKITKPPQPKRKPTTRSVEVPLPMKQQTKPPAERNESKEQPKVYTLDDVKKIAPGYRGKPENFDPSKMGKKNTNPPQPKRKPTTTRSVEVPPPTKQQTTPPAQRNESILSEAIFGVGITVTEIAPCQSFAASYRKIVDIASHVYDAYRTKENQFERVIAREEVGYYATALLHLRLLEVKAKQRNQALTSAEDDVREYVSDDEFNVPQPISIYLNEIGNYCDHMGKETLLEVPPLPVTVVQRFGGYHANAINADTHNLFEEVPSLGIAGDMVMALASPDAEPTPNFHVAIPTHTQVTTNLAGKYFPIGPRRTEIVQRLAGYGITAATFDELVPGTRFNLKYVRSISDILGKFETFRNERVVFKNMGLAGGETQVIKGRPSETEDATLWTERNIQPTSAAKSLPAYMNASFCFGFQLYKEDGPGETRADKVKNWSCIAGRGAHVWNVPDDWYANRNVRRDLPDWVGTERFTCISARQDLTLSNVIKRMIKS